MEEREYQRLKELIDSGRKYHYRNFVFSGLTVAFLFKNPEESLKLFLDIDFSIRILILFLYGVILIFSVIVLDIFGSIWRKANVESAQQVDFNWFVLTGEKNFYLSWFWIMLPWIISCISIWNSTLEIDKSALTAGGLIGIFFPTYLKQFAYKVANKEDGKGNKISLSIYLLYWYRLVTGVLIITMLFYPVVIFISEDKFVSFTNNGLSKIILSLFFILQGIRLIWELKFIHSNVNKFGERFGFAIEYKNPNK